MKLICICILNAGFTVCQISVTTYGVWYCLGHLLKVFVYFLSNEIAASQMPVDAGDPVPGDTVSSLPQGSQMTRQVRRLYVVLA